MAWKCWHYSWLEPMANQDRNWIHVIAIIGKCVFECVWYAFILNAMSFLTQIVFIRPQTVFERSIAELWNRSAFNPSAPSSSCHEDFMSSTDCLFL